MSHSSGRSIEVRSFGFSLAAAFCLVTLLLSLVLVSTIASASTQVILIESPGCTKCAAAERAINAVSDERGGIELVKYAYFSDEGHNLSKKYKAKDVPAIIIGERVINYRDYKGDGEKLDLLIKAALDNKTLDLNATSGGAENDIEAEKLKDLNPSTMLLVFSAGLLAGFNPCLLGILVFLASMVLSRSGRRRDMITMILFFSLGIFAVYFIAGLGMQKTLHSSSAVDLFRYALTGLLLLLGLSQVEDARRLHQGKESLFRSEWTLKYIEAGVSKRKLSTYFFLGALFSLVKLPCIGAVYLAILEMVSKEDSRGMGAAYLFLYNLGIILPILLLGGLMAFGLSPEQVDKFRKDYRVQIRLITGLTLISLAPLIYWEII
jgi:cytochrome c-type biogenesis protein